MKNVKRTTVSDVAKAAQVSTGAVSVVLNGGTDKIGVSEKTRDRILSAARKLGYRINTAARATSTGRYGGAGIIFGEVPWNSILPPERLDALLRVFRTKDLNLSMTCMSDSELTDETVIGRSLARLYADGLLIVYNAEIPPAFTQTLDRLHVPSVWINIKRNTNAVYPDDRAAAKSLTRLYLNRGFKDIVFLNDSGNTHYSFSDRREGYEEAMREAGLVPKTYLAEIDRVNHIVPFAQYARHFDKRRPKRVFICYSNDMMNPLLEVAESVGQFPIQDFQLALFSSTTEIRYRRPITTIRIDETTLANTVAEMFIACVADPSTVIPSCAIPYLPLA